MSMTPEEMVRIATLNADRTLKRVMELDRIRTELKPPLNTANAEVNMLFSHIIKRASVLSDADYMHRLKLLVQLNYLSYLVVIVWIDDLLDELGLVDERSPLRARAEEVLALRAKAKEVLLAGPDKRANPAESMREWRELFGRKTLPNGKDGPLAEAWEDWTQRLREKHPDYQKIVYKEGRNPYTNGMMQSANTL